MVRIVPDTEQQVTDFARRLLAAADDPAQVQTRTDSGSIEFEVPEDLAAAAGFATDDTEDHTEHTHTAEEAPARNASRAVWVSFLEGHPEITYPASATRDELAAVWDARGGASE